MQPCDEIWQRIRFLDEQYLYSISARSNQRVCDGKTLFVGVLTAPRNFEVRKAIRESWAANTSASAVLRFFVGLAEPRTQERLVVEQRQFGDIVIYGLPDKYDKLYLKVYVLMQWQQIFCAQAAFLLKTDDDTVVHIPRLLHHIEKRFRPAMNWTKAVFGYILTSSPVLHSGRWAIPEEAYTPDYYPPYCHGANYLLSNDAVAAILAGTPDVKSLQIEDALYTGVIASNVGVQKVSDEDVFFRGGE
ncbi:beta-1,3-galactosyltransferase 1-like protein, partial [Aphelenchoides avenae]